MAARRASRSALAIRLLAGATFLAFGVGKFVSHQSELASFRDYGLPWPEGFVYAIGVVEVAAGVLLILGLLTRPVALVLAGNMLGAIAVSGVGQGETISLTLAPVLLVAMIALLRLGPGALALDRRARP